MKQTLNFLKTVALFCVGLLFSRQTMAQDGVPLTLQGLTHTTNSSVTSRSAGGITVGMRNDVSLMFSNPAMLSTLEGIQISVGGMQQYLYAKQDQQYGTLQNFSAFPLLVLSQTDLIPDPDTALVNAKNRSTTPSSRSNQADSIQRPFDSIQPYWNASRSKSLPLQGFAAIPFKVGQFKIVAGIGGVEYANLNWYYQNNNNLSPNVLDVTQGTILNSTMPANDYVATPTLQPRTVQWYQSIQRRDGSIYGIGGAVGASYQRFSFGLSVLSLSGSTTDYEARIGRGRMVFYSSSLRLDKRDMTNVVTHGTSDYSGVEMTISGKLETKNLHVGFSVKPPTTITRSYKMQTRIDSIFTQRYASKIDSLTISYESSAAGEDKIEMPWRTSLGVAVSLRENLTIGVEYEVRSYLSSTYTDANGVQSTPWISSGILRCGVEYKPNEWLTLRGGVRQEAEVFQPVTQALRGEPIKYPVYSIGAAVQFFGASLNLAYEYSDMHYVDSWSNAISVNRQINNNIMASVAYELPWLQ